MILQALADHYEDLVRQGKLSPPGWAASKVSYALSLDENGRLINTAPLKDTVHRGKKDVLVPRNLEVPAPVKRSANINPNFLCDHSGYFLGIDKKGSEEKSEEKDKGRAEKCFLAAKKLHCEILQNIHTPAAEALISFWNTWNPNDIGKYEFLAEILDDLLSGVNIVFRFNGKFVHEDPEIRRAWQEHYLSSSNGDNMTCLVTGRQGPVEAVHPAIKGIKGAQSSGAALVSFNAPAFCSYGKKQNFNAPVSQYAAFAYTAAINQLIADKEHLFYIGDTAVLFWADQAEDQYADLFFDFLTGESKYSEDDMAGFVNRIVQGKPVLIDEHLIDSDRNFYVLGIAPNAARLSVRFFMKNSFGSFVRNINQHYERMDIIKPSFDKFDYIPIWKMLQETVNQNSKVKEPSPQMAGDVLKSILTDTRYPATLLNGVVLRIRAEHAITRGRAAIIKAYYLKNRNKDVPQEVLTVALNAESTNIPYQLGRLFSVLENIQMTANPDINATIKDKYFNSASATPAVVFPVIVNLSQKHLKKLNDKKGLQITLETELTSILSKLGDTYPIRLTLAEQGSFQLGYYHQTQERYRSKKEDK